MSRTFLLRIGGALAGCTALPAFAHMTGSATPHLHDGDGWGVFVVLVLTVVVALLDRRRR
jgi:hypothetical protein